MLLWLCSPCCVCLLRPTQSSGDFLLPNLALDIVCHLCNSQLTGKFLFDWGHCRVSPVLGPPPNGFQPQWLAKSKSIRRPGNWKRFMILY